MGVALPAGWRRHVQSPALYVYDGPPVMFARRWPIAPDQWWVSVQIGDVEWHSYRHKTAQSAMLAGSTIIATYLAATGREAEAESVRRAGDG